MSQSIVEAAVCGFGVYKLKGCLYISVFIFAQSDNIVNHRYEGRLLSFLAFFHQLILRSGLFATADLLIPYFVRQVHSATICIPTNLGISCSFDDEQ